MKKLLCLILMLMLAATAVPMALAADEPVVVTVATWQNAVLMNEMLEKFNSENPDIKAVPHEMTGGWFANEDLAKHAAAGTMPDIFSITTPEVPVSNGWLLDLTPYIEAETEKTWYPSTIMKYDGKSYMMPYSLFFYGVIVNKTLLNQLNITIPEYDWTIDEFLNIVEAASTDKYYGLNNSDALITHITPQLNPETGWALINNNLINYNLDDAFVQMVNTTKEVRDKKQALDQVGAGLEGDAQKEAIMAALGVDSTYAAFLQGAAALTFDFSWSLGLDKADGFGGWEWDYYPVPVAEKGNTARTGIVADAVAIRADTANPDAAWRVLKYLTFSEQGFMDKVEIAKAYDKEAAMAKYPDLNADAFLDYINLNDLPGCFTADALQAWSDINEVKPGATHCIAGMANGYLDGFKCVPGWSSSQWDILWPEINDELLTGKKAAADVAVELKAKCEAAVAEAYKAMGIDITQ